MKALSKQRPQKTTSLGYLRGSKSVENLGIVNRKDNVTKPSDDYNICPVCGELNKSRSKFGYCNRFCLRVSMDLRRRKDSYRLSEEQRNLRKELIELHNTLF